MHAHVETIQRDCDGRYDRNYVVNSEQGQDDQAFQSYVLGTFLPLDYRGESVQVTFTPTGFHYSEPTDEGYYMLSVEWCHHDCDTDARTHRDHTAESMGY